MLVVVFHKILCDVLVHASLLAIWSTYWGEIALCGQSHHTLRWSCFYYKEQKTGDCTRSPPPPRPHGMHRTYTAEGHCCQIAAGQTVATGTAVYFFFFDMLHNYCSYFITNRYFESCTLRNLRLGTSVLRANGCSVQFKLINVRRDDHNHHHRSIIQY